MSLTFPNGFIRSDGTIAVGETLAAGGTATIFVQFTPDVSGEYSGNKVAVFDDGSELTVALTGSAKGAAVTPTRLKLGWLTIIRRHQQTGRTISMR